VLEFWSGARLLGGDAMPGRVSGWCRKFSPVVGAWDGVLEFCAGVGREGCPGIFAAGPGLSGCAVPPGDAAAPELGAWLGLLELVCAEAAKALAATRAAANVNFLISMCRSLSLFAFACATDAGS